MSKKVKAKGKAAKQRVTPKETANSRPKDEAEENDNAHDFGGIPNRNLKKNLGCG